MNGLDERSIDCPYCGETIGVLLDCSVTQQNYVEDCSVCCRPIVFDVLVDADGSAAVRASTDQD